MKNSTNIPITNVHWYTNIRQTFGSIVRFSIETGIKMKLFAWILMIIILFGLLIFIDYNNVVKESFNTQTPVKYLNLSTSDPVKRLWITGGTYDPNNTLYLNSLLLFDTSGNQIPYGNKELENTDDNKKNTCYGILHPYNGPMVNFRLELSKPVYLGQIYIRNCIDPNKKSLISGFSLALNTISYKPDGTYSVATALNKYSLNDPELQTGQCDILYKLRSANEVAALKTQSDEAKRQAAKLKAEQDEKDRQNKITNLLNNAKSIETDTQNNKAQFDTKLKQIKTSANNSQYITTKIELSTEASQTYVNDAIIQISSNMPMIDKVKAKEIWDNIQEQHKTAIINLTVAMNIYNDLVVLNNYIVKQISSFDKIKPDLDLLKPSMDQINTYNVSRPIIQSYIDDANMNIKNVPNYIDTIVNMAKNVVNSSSVAETNFNTASYSVKLKQRIDEINAINSSDNEYLAQTTGGMQVEKMAYIPYGINIASNITFDNATDGDT